MTLLARARPPRRPLASPRPTAGPRSSPPPAAPVRRLDARAGLELALADGRGLPWPDGAFDVAHASMVSTTSTPDEAVAFLRELRRVARRGIVVNDLVRGPARWLGGWLIIHAIATSRYTRHDGPLSVRRAYSRPELLELLAAAGLRPVAAFVGFAGHRVAIAAR